MRRTVKALGLAVSVLVLMLSVNAASAQTAKSASVWTTDGVNVKVTFSPGETVVINWFADGTVVINVQGPLAVSEAGFPTGTLSASGTLSFVPSQGNGIYIITVTGAPALSIAVGTILVIPELPIGAIMATTACFVAFGAVKLRRRNFN